MEFCQKPYAVSTIKIEGGTQVSEYINQTNYYIRMPLDIQIKR